MIVLVMFATVLVFDYVEFARS